MPGRPSAEGVTTVFSTTLHITLKDDGTPSFAQFVPPLPADVTACASTKIYKTRFPHGGSATIPIDVTAPSSAP
jgi:hypothetical protein